MWSQFNFCFVFNSGLPVNPMFYAMSDSENESMTVTESKKNLNESSDENSASMNVTIQIL